MGWGSFRVLLLIVLGFATGCGDLFSAYVHHDWDGDNDEALAVNPSPFLLVNGSGSFTLADGCTQGDDASCDNDFGFVTTAIHVSGALVGSDVGLNTFSAGAETGPGEIRVSAESDGGKSMSGMATVEVVLPDGANVQPACTATTDATEPYLVPRASEVVVDWTFTLDGVPRTGWTGEVPVDAPELTLVSALETTAHYLAPDSAGAGRIVQSTMGESSFEYSVYDPSEVVLELEPSPIAQTSTIRYLLHATVEGRAVCVDPSVTVTTSTPDICVFPVGTERVDSVNVTSMFQVLPLLEGTCQVTIAIDDTAVAEVHDLHVAPIPPADLTWFHACSMGGKECLARCQFIGCEGPCCYQNAGLTCDTAVECIYTLTPDSPDTCTVTPRPPVETDC